MSLSDAFGLQLLETAEEETQGWKMMIGGKWVESRSGKRMTSMNPTYDEAVAEVPAGNAEDIQLAVEAGKAAFPAWSKMHVDERAKHCRQFANAVRGMSRELGMLDAIDTAATVWSAAGDAKPRGIFMMKSFVLAGIAAAALAMTSAASAQQGAADFPQKPIRILVAVPAGGGVDTVARVLAARLQSRFGQPVIVENRAGAGGNIGAAAVASSAADGYTLLASSPAPLTVNAVLYKNLDYDPAALRPVAIMALSPNVLAVRKDLPVKSVADLIAHAKANSGKLIYASQGNGTTSHLTTEMFARATETKFMHVPYKGTAPALNDLAGGHAGMIFVDLGSVISPQEVGQVRIIAAAYADRILSLPQVPSVREGGVADFNSTTWYALSAPPKIPAAMTQKLNADIQRMPDIEAHYKKLYVQTSPGATAEMAVVIKDETRRWVDVIRAANITLE